MNNDTLQIDGADGNPERKIDRANHLAGAWLLLQPWLPLVFLAGLLLIAYLTKPGETVWLPGCPFYLLTDRLLGEGLHCPGCGSTRAFHALTHGDLLAALRMNVLALAAIPLLVAGTCSQAWHTRRGTPYKALLYSPRLAWAITVLVIGYGLLRNLPWWPFMLLAPH
ncbi:MAG: DUF2752 domain-containing protein [Armatimonadota bacterium]